MQNEKLISNYRTPYQNTKELNEKYRREKEEEAFQRE